MFCYYYLLKNELSVTYTYTHIYAYFIKMDKVHNRRGEYIYVMEDFFIHVLNSGSLFESSSIYAVVGDYGEATH